MFGKGKKGLNEKKEAALEGNLLAKDDNLQKKEAAWETVSKKGKDAKRKDKKVMLSIRVKVAFIMVVSVIAAVGVNYVYLTSMTEEALISNTESSIRIIRLTNSLSSFLRL